MKAITQRESVVTYKIMFNIPDSCSLVNIVSYLSEEFLSTLKREKVDRQMA